MVPTASNAMDFVLDEKVNERNQGGKEQTRNELPVFDSTGICWAEHDATHSPGKRRKNVENHEDVMPVMVICARDVGPSTTC